MCLFIFSRHYISKFQAFMLNHNLVADAQSKHFIFIIKSQFKSVSTIVIMIN